MTLRKRSWIIGLGLFFGSTVPLHALLYSGGSGPGDASGIAASTDVVNLTSSSDQIFAVNGSSIAAATMTITQELGMPGGGITAANDLRILIPAGVSMNWRNITSVVIGGSASGKVSTTASYENSFQTLVLNVTSDFVDGDYITVSGPAFENFTSTGQASLGLNILNNGSAQAFSLNSVIVQYQFPAVATGGTKDGFDVELAASTNTVVLVSNNDQVFTVNGSSIAAATMTITQELGMPGGGITATNDLRILIPTGVSMNWRNITSVVIGGSASGKVSTTASYENSFQTLVLNVTSDFVDGDYITVSGPAFENFTSTGQASLGLNILNNGSAQAYDPHSLLVQYSFPAVANGGSAEGFGTDGNARYWVASADGNWTNTANWSKDSGCAGGISAPDLGQLAVFDSGSVSSCTFNAVSGVGTLLVASGYSGTITVLSTASVTLVNDFIQSTGDFDLSGSSLTVNGNFTVFGGTFTAGTSTVAFTGSGSYSITSGGQSFNHLVFNNAGGTWTLNDALTVGSDLTLTSGHLIQGVDHPLSVGGNVTLATGAFTRGTGTSKFHLTGDGRLNSGGNNMGRVEVGQ